MVNLAGFHNLLAFFLHTLALLYTLSDGNARKCPLPGWIQSSRAFSWPLQSVHTGCHPKHLLGLKRQLSHATGNNGGVSTSPGISEDTKDLVREFLKVWSNTRQKSESSRDERYLGEMYLERRLLNLVNGTSNDGIVEEYGLNRYRCFSHILEDAELVQQVIEAVLRYRSGENMLLFGEPIAIKDNISVKGIPYTNGSSIVNGFKSTYDAHVLDQLKKQGAIVIAKTTLNEFGVGSETNTTLNPFGEHHMVGGSSGGSASAVGGRIVKMSIGTDTGGSIRLPSAYCGCIGYRPSHGLLSRYGISELAARLDTVGTCTRGVIDAAKILYSMLGDNGHDGMSLRDLRSFKRDLWTLLSKGEYNKARNVNAASPMDAEGADIMPPLKGLRIGSLDVEALVRDGLLQEPVARNIKEVEETLKRLGADVLTVVPMDLTLFSKVYHVYVASQMAGNLQRFADIRYHPDAKHMTVEEMMDLMEPVTAQRLQMGIKLLQKGHDPEKALMDARNTIGEWLRENGIFERLSLLLSPVSASLAPERKEASGNFNDKLKSDMYNTMAPIIGACSVSIPTGLAPSGLPYAVQFTAAPLNDIEMLKVAHVYEVHSETNSRLQNAIKSKDRHQGS